MASRTQPASIGQSGDEQTHAAEVEDRVAVRHGSGQRGAGGPVDSGRSGTSTTHANSSSKGSGEATGTGPTMVAVTSPPTTEAAAFSGWPSTAAATCSGSAEPAAAAAAAASAAEDPRPRRDWDLGPDGDVEPFGAGDVHGHAGGEVGGVAGVLVPLPLRPDRQTTGGANLHLDIEGQGQGQRVEPGPEVGGRGRAAGTRGIVTVTAR